jgi:hypothetical protein
MSPLVYKPLCCALFVLKVLRTDNILDTVHFSKFACDLASAGAGAVVLRDLLTHGPKARGADPKVVRDVSRWQQWEGQALAKDPANLLDKALRHPINTVTFRAAEREAMKRSQPQTQWHTKHALGWADWPFLEATLQVSLPGLALDFP